MRLVRLELKGFKSFAKETVLNFSEDVIGVVGPNGSGKSNIVDAIRWVLGEQKKGELRLDKMSSVIFNGTKNRKAGNVAQVFLTFDNDRGVLRTDFRTITIGRLLFRNGDSEYRLNGVACRRKDITDLFVDTGIESNSYAIIALGMVDDILADNDNSRLRMLEQAAGISIYKLRKRETVARLERTQEDLTRVQDLLFEIEGQLGTLEKQARRTRKYFELKAAYRELSLDYAYISSRSIEAQLKEVTEELERAEEFAAKKQQDLASLELALEGLRESQVTEEQHLAEQRRQLGIVQSKLRQAKSDHQLAAQKLAFLSQNRERLTSQRDQLISEEARLSSRETLQLAAVAEAVSQQEAFAKNLESARVDLENSRAGLSELQTEARARSLTLQKAEQAVHEVDRAIAIAKSRLESLEQEASARARRVEQEIERQRNATAEAEEAQLRLAQLRTHLTEEEDLENKRTQEEERLKRAIEDITPRLQEARSEQQRIDTESALLRRMLDQLEGSPDSVRFLANKQGWKPRYDLLGDVLEIEEEYRPAIESALSNDLNAFVVPDAATAEEGLRVLAEAGQAPTTIYFLSNDLKADSRLAETTSTASEEHAHLRSALEVVRAPLEYQPLIRFLLKDVYVAEERIEPNSLFPGQVAVDKSGAQIWTASSGHGGSRSKLLGRQTGRRQMLAQLEVRIEEVATEVADLGAERGRAEQDLKQLRAEANPKAVKQLRQLVGEAERSASAAQARLEGFGFQQEERERIDREASQRMQALNFEIVGLGERLTPLLESLDLARRAKDDDQEASVQASEVLAKASAAYNAANLAYIQHQNRVATLERELKYSGEQLAEVRQARTETANALTTDGSDINHLSGQLAELENRIRDGEITREQHDGKLREREHVHAAERSRLIEDERRSRLLQREAIDAAAIESRLRERRAELGFRRDAVAERLRIEFSLDLSEVLIGERTVTSSLTGLEAQLAKQKLRLDQFGEINPLAVDAYDEMAERRTVIDSQKSDIVGAMEDLRLTVSEIDRTATEQLLTAFNAVREHFIEVFRHLFDAEDTADMIMLDPDNPLESKIEIVAKPKGKRPQSISQLSGGEKTLTATAFLFALYLIKPAPFCIFDEVDAPLDDANVEKFNRIIKRFSKDSQFIIVTHNKLTMAAVDTIYGVYMPELGVSQVAAVDFREFEHSDVLEMVG